MFKKIIDLTLELYNGIETWEGVHPPVTMIEYHQSKINRYRNEQLSPGFDTKLLMMTDHTGTHVDAQCHLHPGGWTLEQLPLESMMGEAALLDASFRNLDEPITVDILEEALRRSKEDIKKNDILIVKGWPYEWGTEGFQASRAMTGDTAEWILNKKVKLFGMDLPTVDDKQNPDKDLHVKLLKNNIPIMENLVSLEKIGKSRFYFIGLPLKIKGATGSPIRALALIV